MVNYPARIDNSTSLPSVVDNFTPISSSVYNRLRDAILAVEQELGVKPSGLYSTVKARLDTLEDVLNRLVISPIFGGDLEAISPQVINVIGISGYPIDQASIADGYVLTFDSVNSEWVGESKTAFPITFSGDLTGTDVTQTIVNINSVPIPSSYPDSEKLLKTYGEKAFSQNIYGLTTDGYSIWVADGYNASNNNYGGIGKIELGNNWVSSRDDLDSTYFMESLAYLDGYIYATCHGGSYGTMPYLIKINPLTGAIINTMQTDDIGYLYVAETTLWLIIPTINNCLYSVNKTSLDCAIIDFGLTTTTKYGITYDSVNDKLWFAHATGQTLFGINPNTSAIENVINNEYYTAPAALSFDGANVWIVDNLNATYVLDTDGYVGLTIVDTYSHLTYVDYLVFDSTNNKMCAISNNPTNPRLVTISMDSPRSVDGVISLSNMRTNCPIFVDGYIWATDDSGFVQKFDTSLKDDPDTSFPWTGLIASINTYEPEYIFTSINQRNTKNITSGSIRIAKTDVIITCDAGVNVLLPQNPDDGEMHTIIDATGGASGSSINIYANSENDTLLFTIADNYGALTITWSSTRGIWYVVSYYYVAV